MQCCVFLVLTSLACAATPQVEVRDSEVWLILNGQARQLTRDGKAKLQAVLSPSGNRVAYYEQCPEAERCTPSVVILDLEGHRMGSFHPKPAEAPCASILSITWTEENAIAAECHINPSLNEYIETDVSTGQPTRALLGYGFTPSPDGKKVAHAGWIVHFAPPYAQSSYLQFDRTTVYPLPRGMRPVEQKALTAPPNVVRHRGLTYSGIHEFMPGLSWSPDSQRIALIDCTYDWTANNPGSLSAADGKKSNRRCRVAIVSVTGELALLPLTGVSVDDIRGSRLSWVNTHQLSLHTHGLTKALNVP